MIRSLAGSFMELVFISPLILLFLNKKSNYLKVLLLFAAYYLLNDCLLTVPLSFPKLDFLGGSWNWTGKLFAITGSLGFYFIFRKYFTESYFLTFSQKPGSLKTVLIVSFITLLIYIVSSFLFNPTQNFNPETLAFQITMPGLEEELAFRAIMLGLLSSVLIKEITINKVRIISPSILITAILFGLGHSFYISENWLLLMNWEYFGGTFVFAVTMGWLTLKSRSILFPTINHNLCNFLINLIAMLK